MSNTLQKYQTDFYVYLVSNANAFDRLIGGTAPVFWLFFLATGVALFVLRYLDRGIERPFALLEVGESPQRFHDERRVAQPAVAVVPGPLRPHGLGNARRRGGDPRCREEASGSSRRTDPSRPRRP